MELGGHVPFELSRLLAGFLASDESNSLTVQVCGKRKREVGLVIPECYNARTSRKKIADILSTEIKNIKERYPHFELEIEQDATRTLVLTKQERNKLIDFIVHLFLVYKWFSGKGAFVREGRLIQICQLRGASIR